MKKRFFLLVLLLSASSIVFSQTHYLKQVIVVNGGLFEAEDPTDYVTVASFNPETGSTIIFDTIFTQSTQCVVIDQGFAYVAAQDSVVMYNLDTYERVAETKVGGVNQLKLHNDYLIVGRQWPASNTFVKIYDKNDLTVVSSFEGISGDTYGITVKNDTAYIAVNGGWAGVTGSLVSIDLTTETPEFIEEYDLGEQAMGISQIYLYNDGIVSVNKSPYGAAFGSFTFFNTVSRQVTSTTIDFVVGNGIALVNTTLYCSINSNIGSFDVETREVVEDIIVDSNDSLDILKAAFDDMQNQFFVNFSSYVTPGTGKVYNMSGEEVDSYDVGISAEAIALDYRVLDRINEAWWEKIQIVVYPNPCMDFITIQSEEIVKMVEIYDISGKRISRTGQIHNTSVTIPMSEIYPGIYFITIKTENRTITQSVIKK